MPSQTGIDQPLSLPVAAARVPAMHSVPVHRRSIERWQVHGRTNRLGNNSSAGIGDVDLLAFTDRVNKPVQTSDSDIDI